MPTLIVQVLDTPDGWICRCPSAPAWRPRPSEHVDKPKMEKSLRGHVTRNTRISWFGWEDDGGV